MCTHGDDVNFSPHASCIIEDMIYNRTSRNNNIICAGENNILDIQLYHHLVHVCGQDNKLPKWFGQTPRMPSRPGSKLGHFAISCDPLRFCQKTFMSFGRVSHLLTNWNVKVDILPAPGMINIEWSRWSILG